MPILYISSVMNWPPGQVPHLHPPTPPHMTLTLHKRSTHPHRHFFNGTFAIIHIRLFKCLPVTAFTLFMLLFPMDALHLPTTVQPLQIPQPLSPTVISHHYPQRVDSLGNYLAAAAAAAALDRWTLIIKSAHRV